MFIASLAGAIQGLLSFLGGCVATYDKNINLDSDSISLWEHIIDTKYNCGFIKLRRAPTNINKEDEECDTDFGMMDRGWYSRVHNYCLQCSGDECDVDACDLNGFRVVLAYAIVCGAGWAVVAIAAFISFILDHRKTGIVVSIAYIITYIIFIGLFTAAWSSAKKVDKECLNKACKEIKSQGKRSSREILAYSICSFITILAAIICSSIAVIGLGKPSTRENEEGPNNEESVVVKQNFEKGKPYYVSDSLAFHEEKDNGKDYKMSAIGQEFNCKFNQLNNYIVDKSKLQKYAKKKFIQADIKNNGVLALDDVKDCIIKLIHNKGLPIPSDENLKALMRRYDTGGSNKLERSEFEQLLLDVFMESKDLLVEKYAIKKANSWMFNKTKVPIGTPKLRELNELLNNTEEFDDALGNVIVKEGKNASSILSIDEVTEIAKIFCNRYAVPVLTRQEITEIMREMGKGTSEYDANDLSMAIYAVLSVSKNLVV